MTGSIYNWSITAASNANSDGDINFAEGQASSTLNNSSRQVMGRLAEILGDMGGALTAGGTANVLTVTANSAFTAYADGLILALRIATDNTTAATLNANGLGAKSIRKMVAAGETALVGAELQATGIYLFRYSTALNSAAGGWLLLNPTIDVPNFATLTGTEVLTNKSLTSPALTGTPTTPTAAPGTNTTQVSSTAFVTAAIAALSSVYQAASAVLTALAGIGTAVAGDVIYATGAGAWGRLAKGSALQQLRMNSGGTAPEWATPSLGIAKVWANFNPSSGSVVVRSSFNASSITRNSTGDYTVNFTTAMADVNYAVIITPGQGTVSTYTGQVTSQLVGSCRFTVQKEGTGLLDPTTVSVVIFGN